MTGGAPAFSDWKEACILAWDATAGVTTIRYEPWCTPEPIYEVEEEEEGWWATKMSLGSDQNQQGYEPHQGKQVEIAALFDCREVKR